MKLLTLLNHRTTNSNAFQIRVTWTVCVCCFVGQRSDFAKTFVFLEKLRRIGDALGARSNPVRYDAVQTDSKLL